MSLEKLLGRDDLFDGRYKILDILGKGGMSTVYLAENSKLGTLWAIKEKSKSLEVPGDINSEVDVLKRLEHPALPRIYDVIENEDFIYVIEDYISGTTLDRELAVTGRFNETRVLEWSLQLCDVLSYLHSVKPNPVIYRDIKPSNIMLTHENRIKLVDFGSAREYKSISDCDTVYLGTVGFAAPEQYGQGQTDVTSDIYSLGITIYNLVTGINPGQIPFEPNPASGLSPELEAIILKCTRFQPSERYRNIDEVKEAVKRLVEPHSVKNPAHCNSNGSRELISFKRLVLCVWDNPEFACELAHMTAGLTRLKVLIIIPDEYRDAYFPRLGLRNMACSAARPASPVRSGHPALNAVNYANDFNAFNAGAYLESCIKVEGSLYALTIPLEKIQEESEVTSSLEQAIATSYQHFDITITALRRCLCSKQEKAALLQSDYIIIAAAADLNMLLEWTGQINHVKAACNLQLLKLKYVAYEYKKGINLPLSFLNSFFSPNCNIGYVSYSREREICRNSGTIYSRILQGKNPDEYAAILSFFNIYPKPGFKARMIGWLRKHRLFGWLSGKNNLHREK